ncbi:MAG: four helix bundle protein [Planctomycetaceae bacterium]|nr:four helix bundle protein [Planctomycetaceae bacterium]
MPAGDSQETDRRYDLAERTAVFGENVIRFVKTLARNEITRPLISQLVRSGTSVGANYAEADDSGTRKEFFHRISICQRESRESMHWLRMIVAADPECRDSARTLWTESKELNHIFAAIHRKHRKNTS